MESHFAELSKLICLEPVNDVQFVGITGMGGIGKSTLVRALYESISHRFNSCCYIDDVSKVYQGYGGTLEVQKQLLSQCLNERNLDICNVSNGTLETWKRLSNAKALIVLDNVDQDKQLDMFTGGRDDLLRKCLGRGSIVIIISRDQQILRAHRVDVIYQVKPLNGKDAVRLFCRKTFKSNYIMSDFEELTCDALLHCQGHPLAIKVLGSSLFGKDVLYWRSALASLRENESKNIMNVLRISFDQLEHTHKEIFLDIACFFNGTDVDYVKEVLNFRGFHPEYGLQVLVDKSLITMNQTFRMDKSLTTMVGSCIRMHDLLCNLGKCVVREKSPMKPWKWSRLWDFKDLHKIMSHNKAAENVEAIVMPLKNYIGITMRVDGLSTMTHLKLLILGSIEKEGRCVYHRHVLKNYVLEKNFFGMLVNLSNELGYFNWPKYPFECLPPSFQPDKLLELILTYSNIKQLWKGTKSLPNLRRLDLSHSKNLIKMPYIGDALYLEKLYLEGCIQLEDIGLSIVLSRKLTSLDLKDCKSLIKLPQFGEDLILRVLELQGCQKLKHIDPSIGLLKKLTYLNLENCKNLVSLPNSILGLNSLKYLYLSGCLKLYNTELLYELRDAEHLEKIDIDGAPIHFQSTSSHSREHKKSVGCLMPSSPIFPCLYQLDLSFCNLVQIPDAIGIICCLERLDLSGNNFATLPNLKKLSKLLSLKLQHCKQLKSLPELHEGLRPTTLNIQGLYIFNCPELVDREGCTDIAFSWMIQMCQLKPRLSLNNVGSVCPGSEIPRWFNNQHEGNCVNVDASPAMHDDNWIGVAFCAIFVVPHQTLSTMAFSKTEGQLPEFGDILVDFYGNLDIELVLDKSDHMWLFFVHRQQFIQQCHLQRKYIGKLIWDRYANEMKKSNAKVVKKYGYRWLYKEDIEQLSNPLARKRKFGAIEQNEGTNKDVATSSQENTINLLIFEFENLSL